MVRCLFSFLLIAMLISSCGNKAQKESAVKSENPGDAVKVEFASLVANPDNFIGKNIIVEGKVVHVCMETGKKLFIVGENPDVRLYIQAGETMPKFPMDLLGSTVSVEGKITKPAAATMAMQEKPMREGASKTDSAKACETEAALSGQTALADVVMEYKSHILK